MLHSFTLAAAPREGGGREGRALARAGQGHGRGHRRAARARLDVPAGRAPRASTSPPSRPEAKPLLPVEKADSVGCPNAGRLEGGVHLDTSRPYFRVVPVYEPGDVRWGLPAMVNLIDRAARAVYKRYPGAVLDVGDLSRKGGGDVIRHRSHESGRDADLGFYVLDARGKQIHGRIFIKFDAAGESPTVPGARFDLDRNWLLIQSMLTDPGARVSHIFVAEPLRQRLLAHARTRGVSRALLNRAAVVLMQPTGAMPHDDHLHVRISCPASMRGSCVELAKNAPHGRGRVAHKGHRVLHTPGKAAATKSEPAGAHGRKKPPAASGEAPQELFTLDLPEDEDEEGGDGGEGKEAVEESGAGKSGD